jgi:hypothetical protein
MVLVKNFPPPIHTTFFSNQTPSLIILRNYPKPHTHSLFSALLCLSRISIFLQTFATVQSTPSPLHHLIHIYNGRFKNGYAKDGFPHELYLSKGGSPSSPHQHQIKWRSTCFLWYVPKSYFFNWISMAWETSKDTHLSRPHH